MRTLKTELYYPSRKSKFHLYYLTDLHIGAKACDERLLRQTIQTIANDPFAYWIGGGDYIDAIARKGDKRYQESTLAPWLRGQDDTIGQQRDYVVEILKPIARKCLGLVCGNHEYAALKYYDRNIYWEFVRRMADLADKEPGALALGVQGFLVIRFRRGTKKKFGGSKRMIVYCHHGYGGGRLPGGHALALGRVLGDYSCHLALLGHRHVQHAISKVVAGPGSTGAKMITRYGVFCGSYLNTYVHTSTKKCPVDTYPEHKGLPPSLLGTPLITIRPDKMRIAVQIGEN